MTFTHKKAFLLACLFVLTVAASATASEFYSAGAYGMGGAYTAIASDISALQINPAGLGQTGFLVTGGGSADSLQSLDFLQDLQSMDNDAWEKFKSIAVNGQGGVGLGGLGVGLFVDGNIRKSDDQIGFVEVDAAVRGSLGFGARLLALPLNAAELRIGLSVDRYFDSYAEHQIGGDQEPEFNADAEGWALNAGMLARLGILSVGVGVKDLYNAASGENAENAVKVEPSFRAGAAIRLPILGLVLAGDYELPPGNPLQADPQTLNQNATIRLGAEARLLFLKVRAGQVMPPIGPTLTTLGAGIQFGPLCADVAAGSTNQFKENSIDNVMAQLSIRF